MKKSCLEYKTLSRFFFKNINNSILRKYKLYLALPLFSIVIENNSLILKPPYKIIDTHD